MTVNGWLQLAVFFLAVIAVTKPLGVYMTRVFSGEKTFLSHVLGPVERLIYRVCRIDAEHEQRWTVYTAAMLMFSVASLLVLYAMQRLQYYLPFNPQQFPGVAPDLAFNTAASFTTNTNWQAYAGESTMSYLVQMAGLAFHNFVSAATGIVLAIAFIRGIARRNDSLVGECDYFLVTVHVPFATSPSCPLGRSDHVPLMVFPSMSATSTTSELAVKSSGKSYLAFIFLPSNDSALRSAV